MRIIEAGKKPIDTLWRGDCRACRTKFEAKQSELTNITAGDQRTETFARENCSFCDTPSSVILYPTKDNVPTPAADQGKDTATVTRIRDVVLEYYAALEAREHGGVAQNKAFQKIENVLGLSWHK